MSWFEIILLGEGLAMLYCLGSIADQLKIIGEEVTYLTVDTEDDEDGDAVA